VTPLITGEQIAHLPIFAVLFLLALSLIAVSIAVVDAIRKRRFDRDYDIALREAQRLERENER
jgi:uncharacterized membrane protein